MTASKNPIVEKQCEECGKPMRVTANRLADGRGRTCSVKCRTAKVVAAISVPLEIRFWRHVQKTGTCWLWVGHRSPAGYGILRLNRTDKILAHRASWTVHGRQVPNGLCLDHICRVRHCVNPDHLEAVTLRTNTLRGIGGPAINARKQHCKNGHPLSGDNVRIEGGRRRCKVCQSAYLKARRSA